MLDLISVPPSQTDALITTTVTCAAATLLHRAAPPDTRQPYQAVSPSVRQLELAVFGVQRAEPAPLRVSMRELLETARKVK